LFAGTVPNDFIFALKRDGFGKSINEEMTISTIRFAMQKFKIPAFHLMGPPPQRGLFWKPRMIAKT